MRVSGRFAGPSDALSSSTLLPLTPIAPTIVPSAFFSGRPPGNVISPSFETSMWQSGAPGWASSPSVV